MSRLIPCLTVTLCLLLSGAAWGQMEEEQPTEEKKSGIAEQFEQLEGRSRSWRPKRWTSEAREAYFKKRHAAYGAFYEKHKAGAATAAEQYILGKAAFFSKKYAEALASYDKALPGLAGTEKESCAYYRITVLRRLKKYALAARAIDAFITDYPQSKRLLSVKRAKGSVAADLAKAQLVGKPAPALDVEKTQGGEAISLAKLKGKVVVLDFFATWCGPCRKVIPHLVALQEKHRKAGLVVVGVTRLYTRGYLNKKYQRDLTPEAEYKLNEDFRAEWKLNYPVVFSKAASKSYSVRGIPTLFLVDRDGVVRHFKVGSGDTEELDKKIAELLARPASEKTDGGK